MRTGINIGVFPIAFLENYKKLGLSDNDVLNVLAFLNTDATLESAARIRGYSSTTRMLAAMQHMLDKGLIVQVNKALDFTPLFAACDSPKEQKGTFELKPKPTNKNPEHFRAYEEIQSMVFGSKFVWAAFFKQMETKGYTLDDVVACVKYINSYYSSTKRGLVKTVNTPTVAANIDEWANNGKRTVYQENTVDTDEIMRLANEN